MKSSTRTRHIQFYVLLGVFGVIMLNSCTNQPSQKNTPEGFDSAAKQSSSITEIASLPATQENFNSFLRFFKRSDSYRHWPDSVQFKLLENDDFFKKGKDYELVKSFMREIPREYEAFLPEEDLANIDDYYPVKSPIDSYRFFAFEKVEAEDYWLLSMLAFKTPYREEEYHEHYFFASTYDKSGLPIEDFVWWGIVNDDVQIPDNASAVWADTLIAGHMGRIDLRIYDEIYLKVLLRPDGTFDTVYYHPPEPSMF